jgi:hypothetical protein
MMLIALVLLCSIKVTPDLQDCTRDNATAVLRVPGEFAHPAACLLANLATMTGPRSSVLEPKMTPAIV